MDGLIICDMTNNGRYFNSVLEAASVERCFDLYRRDVMELVATIVFPRCYDVFEPNLFYDSGCTAGIYVRLFELDLFVKSLAIQEARIRSEFKSKLGPWTGRYSISLLPHEHPSEYYSDIMREFHPDESLVEAEVNVSSGFNSDQWRVFRHVGTHLNYFDQKLNELNQYISTCDSYPLVSYGFMMHPMVRFDKDGDLFMFISDIIDKVYDFNMRGIPIGCYEFGSGSQRNVGIELRLDMISPKKWSELRDKDRCHRNVLRIGVTACMPSDDEDINDDS